MLGKKRLIKKLRVMREEALADGYRLDENPCAEVEGRLRLSASQQSFGKAEAYEEVIKMLGGK